MVDFPAITYFVSDFILETQHMCLPAVGAHANLLNNAWARPDCRLPDNDAQLMRMARSDPQHWAEIRDTVLALWPLDGNGMRQHPGLSKQRAFAVKARAARQKGAAKAKEAREAAQAAADGNAEHAAEPDAEHPAEQGAQGVPPSPLPSPSPLPLEKTGVDPAPPAPRVSRKGKAGTPIQYTADFETLWKSYPKRDFDSKSKAFDAWSLLSPEQQTAALAAVPDYRAKVTPQYACKVAKYLLEGLYEGQQSKREQKEADWRLPLLMARERDVWDSANWGPQPHQPGCRVPRHLLLETDGRGWDERDPAKAINDQHYPRKRWVPSNLKPDMRQKDLKP